MSEHMVANTIDHGSYKDDRRPSFLDSLDQPSSRPSLD